MALALAACRSGAGTGPHGATPSRGAETAVSATLQEYEIGLSATSVPSGTVTFTATNEGPDAEHELVVLRTNLAPDALPTKDDASVDEDGQGLEIVGEIPEFPPGQTGTVALPLAPGHYVLICNLVTEENGQLESHYAFGMRTALTVTG
jgi:hypothetical protein